MKWNRRLAGCGSGYSLSEDTIKDRKCANRTRLIFLISAGMILLCCYALINYGLMILQEANNLANENIPKVQDLIYDAQGLLGAMITAQRDVTQVDWNKIYHFDALCPNIMENNSIKELAESMISSNEYVDRFVSMDVKSFLRQTSDILSVSYTGDDILDHIAMRDWYMKAYVMVMGSFTIVFIIGTMTSFFKKTPRALSKYLSYFILPLFCILTVATIFVTVVFLAAALLNADFCSGGEHPGNPETSIMQIMHNLGVNSATVLYESADYVRYCPNPPPIKLLSTSPNLQKIVETAETYLIQLEDFDSLTLSQNCKQPATELIANSQIIVTNLKAVLGVSIKISQILSCDNVKPIYNNILHSAACHHLPLGITYTLASILGISICAMILITLRASFINNKCLFTYEDQIELTESENDSFWNATAPEVKTVVSARTVSTADTEDVTTITAEVVEVLPMSPVRSLGSRHRQQADAEIPYL